MSDLNNCYKIIKNKVEKKSNYLTAFVPDALVDAIPPKLASAPGSVIDSLSKINNYKIIQGGNSLSTLGYLVARG